MYVFINGDDTGKRQWRLVDAGNGRVRAELVREMTFDSQTEGCVVDDDSGILYVNEEDVAMWRMSAEPDGGDARTAVERVADNPAHRDDLAGGGIYHPGAVHGAIVAARPGTRPYAGHRQEGGEGTPG